jgi:hypothetical protein
VFCPDCGDRLGASRVSPETVDRVGVGAVGTEISGLEVAVNPAPLDDPIPGIVPPSDDRPELTATGEAVTDPVLARRLKGCPYCLWKIVDVALEDLRICGSCRASYHRDCYEENGGCAIFGCPEWTAGQMALASTVAAPSGAAWNPPPPVVVAAPLPAPVAPPRNFCTSCGHRAGPAYIFCGYCGASVT